MSADGAEADRAIEVGGFETLQISFSVLEQGPARIVADATRHGLGVIAKQPLANGIPGMTERPGHSDWARKWDLAQELDWAAMGTEPRLDLALRFVLEAPGVASAIVGTARFEHLERNTRVASSPQLARARS